MAALHPVINAARCRYRGVRIPSLNDRGLYSPPGVPRQVRSSLAWVSNRTDDGEVKLAPRAHERRRHRRRTDQRTRYRALVRYDVSDVHLRRLDVWPTGDFSVRARDGPAWGIAVPAPRALDGLGNPLRPYRSVVACSTWKVSADPDLFATSSVRAVS